MSFYIATLAILFVVYRQFRSRPLRDYAKLQRSIDLYQRQEKQILAVETRLQTVPSRLSEHTLSTMTSRRKDLRDYVQNQCVRYQALYERPLYRIVFCLPVPPEFKC